MDSSCEQELHTKCGETPGDPVLCANEMENSAMDSFTVLNSTVEDVSDEEISTKRERHWRLGPEDLNDTLVYDFTEFEAHFLYCGAKDEGQAGGKTH